MAAASKRTNGALLKSSHDQHSRNCFCGWFMLSNGFKTFALYWHRKSLGGTPWFVAAIISWGIAFFDYMIQVPANRAGHPPLVLRS